MKLLQSLPFLLSFVALAIGAEVEGSGEAVQVVAPEGSGEIVVAQPIPAVVVTENVESELKTEEPLTGEVKVEDENNKKEQQIVVTESIDGSAPNVDLVDTKEEKKEENKDQKNKRRPYGANKFFASLTVENRKAVSDIFKQKNVTREEKKKQLDAYFEKIGVKKSYEENKNKVRALQAISRKRLSNAVQTLPAAVTILDSIVDDKSLNAKQIGAKVGSLVRALNKDTATSLFTLKRLFAQKPRVNRFSTIGKGKVNFFQKGSKVETNDKQPFKKQILPLPTFGKFQRGEEGKESTGPKKLVMPLKPFVKLQKDVVEKNEGPKKQVMPLRPIPASLTTEGPKKLVMPLEPTTTAEQKIGSETTTVLATTDVQTTTVVSAGSDITTVSTGSETTTVPATTDVQATSEVPATTVSL